jgi:hypothetical protein
MSIQLQDDLIGALETAGFHDDRNIIGMHLGEIEAEAENVLDLFTVLRSHAHRDDVVATQETLAEMTIALEHLLSHIQSALPGLQKQLGIEPE